MILEEKEVSIPCYDIQSFENEWMEVELKPALNWGLSDSTNALNIPTASNDWEQGVPHFLCEEIDIAYLQGDMDCISVIYIYRAK